MDKREPKNFWIVIHDTYTDITSFRFDSYKSAVKQAYDLKEKIDGRFYILKTVGYVDNKRDDTHESSKQKTKL